MKNSTYLKTILIAAGVLTYFISNSVSAASSNGYIYKVNKGQSVIYSDIIPADEKSEVVVLSSGSGTIKTVMERELTKTEVRDRAKEYEQQVAQNIKEAEELKRDNLILQTYTSVEDIEKYKNYELSQINQSINVNIDNIAIYKDRIESIESDLKKSPNNQKLKTELEKTKVSLSESQKTLDTSKKLYVDKDDQYNADKARYLRVLEQIKSQQNISDESEQENN